MSDRAEKQRIAVVGAGYVGSAMAALLAQHAHVTVTDILPEKTACINARRSPVKDRELERFLAEASLDLSATTDTDAACREADVVVIAVPTDFREELGHFDTSAVEKVIGQAIGAGTRGMICIASTVPVGFTAEQVKKTGYARMVFLPEFLRETHALEDLLSPSRIVMGVDPANKELYRDAERFLALLKGCMTREDVPVLVTGPAEAEAAKLFSNAYLAMRVAFFNELDGFAEERGLDAEAVIRGVGLDPRIGSHYNNPSFGYGGYCLPKDTKELLHEFGSTRHALIEAVVRSNEGRAKTAAEQILNMAACSGKDSPVIGIWRLIMKSGSDNFRASAVINVIRELRNAGAEVIVYEPELGTDDVPYGCRPVSDADRFIGLSDVIVCNRFDRQLSGVREKVYTRDLFGVN